MMRSWRHLVMIVCCLFLLSGCAVRMLYNWLDWAIVWKLDDYFDLSRKQKNVLGEQVDELLQWHRKQALPDYVVALRALSFDLRRPLTEAEVEHHLQTFERLSRQLAEGLKTPANRFAVVLTDEQIQQFVHERWKKLREQRDEFKEKNGQKVYASFKKKLEKNLRNWIGDLDPAQQPLIEQSSQWQRQYYASWLDYQEVWVQAVEKTLAARGTPEFERGLVLVLLNGDELGDGRFRQYLADSRARSVTWLPALSASLTPRQREELRGRLSDLAADLEALHKG